MKFELDFFEDFLQRELIENRTIEPVVADFEAKKELIAQAIDRVKLDLRSQVFSQKNESRLERLIQHYQTCIIGLADEVLKLLDEDEARDISTICPKHSWCNLAKILYKSLDELLTYIENYFSKFFNQQAKIPNCYAILSAREIEEKLNAILAVTEHVVDAELHGIFTAPLKAFIQNPIKAALSFSQLIYYKTLVAELGKCTEVGEDDLTAAITNKLLYLNFNTSEFLRYYTERIIKQMKANTHLPSQLDQLAYQRKLICQVQLKPGFAFKPNHPFDIQKKIFLWLSEEINYIEKRKHLKLITLPANEPDEPANFKIATSLSVPQLALFFKLLVDSKIISVPNITLLMKFIAGNFSSLRNENMSNGSIRNRYYHIEDTTYQSMAETLNKLILRCKKGNELN